MSLKLYRYPKRSPNWIVRGTIGGIVVDESTKTADRATAEQIRAEKEIETWQIANGRALGQKQTPTFLAAAVDYLEAGGERRWMDRVLQHFGTLAIDQIDQAAIEAAAKVLYPPGVSPRACPRNATINRHVFTPVSAVLNHAGQLTKFNRPKQPKGRVRWIEPEDAAAFLAASDDKLRPLVTFLLYTGCRISEAVNLTWDDINLQRRSAYIRKTKNGNPRNVHLPEPVFFELANMAARGARLFGYNDRGVAYRHFVRTAKAAGIADFTPHDCRHTYATWMRRYGGLDLIGLMQAGGWENIQSVARYAHVAPNEAARAADSLPTVSVANRRAK